MCVRCTLKNYEPVRRLWRWLYLKAEKRRRRGQYWFHETKDGCGRIYSPEGRYRTLDAADYRHAWESFLRAIATGRDAQATLRRIWQRQFYRWLLKRGSKFQLRNGVLHLLGWS